MRSVAVPNLVFLLLGCLATPNNSIPVPALPDTLNAETQAAYEQRRPILLFAYSDDIQSTEAYADWAAYLNEFKADASAEFYF